MAPITPTPLQLRTAYRHLYRASLEAVQYSVPARLTARDCLRAAFRTVPAANTTSSSTTSSSTSTSEFITHHTLLPPLASSSSSTTSTPTTPPSLLTQTQSSRTIASLTSPVGSGATVSHPGEFDPDKISRTLEFLHTAAQRKGLAHKIVRNLLRTRYWHWVLWKERWRGVSTGTVARGEVGRGQDTVDSGVAGGEETPEGRKRRAVPASPATTAAGKRSTAPWDSQVTREGIVMFEQTVRMLNESMGMCLRV